MKEPSKELKHNILEAVKQPPEKRRRIVNPLQVSRNVFRITSLVMVAIIIHITAKIPKAASEELIPLIGLFILLSASVGFIFFMHRIKKGQSNVTGSKNHKSS